MLAVVLLLASCALTVQASWYGSSYPGYGSAGHYGGYGYGGYGYGGYGHHGGYGGYAGYGWPCVGGSCSGYNQGYGGYGSYGQYYGAYAPSYGGYGQYYGAYAPSYGGYGHHYSGYSPSYGDHSHTNRYKRGAELIALPSKVANHYGENYTALENNDLYSYYAMAAYQNWKHEFVKYSKNYRAPVKVIGTEREEEDHCIELTTKDTKARRHVAYKEHEHLKHLSIKAIFRYFNQPTQFGLGRTVAKCGDKVACWTDTILLDVGTGMTVSDPFYTNEGCVAFSDPSVIDELCDAQDAAVTDMVDQSLSASSDATMSFLADILVSMIRRSHPQLSEASQHRFFFYLSFAGGYRECVVHLDVVGVYDSDEEMWNINGAYVLSPSN